MKTLLLLPLLLLSGCALANLPPNSCESASFSLNVGPFFAQHATLAGVIKNSDGSYSIGNFTGDTSYLGVVTTVQSFHDLKVGAEQAAATPGK